MVVSAGSGNAGSLSGPLFASFEVSVYLLDYAEKIDLCLFQVMPAREDSHTVTATWPEVSNDTRVGT